MPSFSMKRGDTSPTLEYETGVFEDGSGVFVGASATFFMKSQLDASLLVSGSATIADIDGVLHYAWTAGDTDVVGPYDAEFEVTYLGGRVETFPRASTDPYLTVTVTQDLGDA